MKYAFKMMTVVLTLGVLVLQGCVTSSAYVSPSLLNDVRAIANAQKNIKPNNEYLRNQSNYVICLRSKWLKGAEEYKDEAIRRNIVCGENGEIIAKLDKKESLEQLSNSQLLVKACNRFNLNGIVEWHNFSAYQKYVKEAIKRGLECDINNSKQANFLKNQDKEVLNLSDKEILQTACINGSWDTSKSEYISVANKRSLDCIKDGIAATFSVLNKVDSSNSTSRYGSSIQIEAANNRAIELERRLATLESKQKQEQQRINTDKEAPLLQIIFNKTQGKRGTITGIARDNIEVAEVTVDRKPVLLSSNGKFKFSTYVPPTGKELKIEVTDISGLTTSKVVVLKADRVIADLSISFDSLNPLDKRAKINKNALALIVGVSSYENTKAKAMYADNDAMVFKDYATEKLGISENRIKMLINDGADYGEILLTTKDWLRRASKANKSDIYIFFAGHGLASDDGKNMYLLPYDGRPRLLDKTALLRDELFKEIQQSNPRSVTVFLDTCYSGTTRGTDMLVASRPIMIKAKEQSIPSNFTVFSAAAGDQTSKPLEEAKHGMFSYFLMKGMEGDADANNDNKITARELHAYVEQNVVQQSSGSQTPELQGDKDRVLVQFN